MKIALSPQVRDGALTLSRSGDTLIINGEPFDFSGIPEGATLPAGAVESDWIAGPVERIDGKLHVSVLFPIAPNASEAQRFPAPIIDPPNGPILLPPGPEREPEEEGGNDGND